ncbi:MAG: HEAT repeat domain-containing protein [Candidatus Aminicenantales bacterium]
MGTTKIKKIAIVAAALALISCSTSAFQTAPRNAKEAAVPKLDDILKRLASYDGGLHSDAFFDLRAYVQGHKDVPQERLACEEKLLAFLAADASLPAKTAVCRQLRVIGGEKSVSVLEKMLPAADTTDMARYALEKIPGADAEDALIGALGKTKGDIKMGIIASLGQRRAKGSVAELAKLIRGTNQELAGAAATALGQIGGMDAAEALGKALGPSRPGLKDIVASALFRCAEEFTALKDQQASFQIYDRILVEKLPVAIRRAAWRGKIASSGSEGRKGILETLAGPDLEMHAAAIGLIKNFFGPADIGPIVAALPKVPEASQISLLAVLAEYPKESVLPVVSEAAKNPSKDIRMAGIKALEKAGDASVVPFLAETAAAAPRAEQAVARNSLWGLRGKDADEAILALLAAQPSEGVQAELIQSVGERRIFAGKGLAVGLTDSPSAKVRTQALRAVKAVGTPSDIPGLLDLLLKTKDEADRLAVENAITGLAQKIANPDGRAGAVQAKLEGEKDARKRCLLYGVLGKIGDGSSLALLREALQDPDKEVADAAVRALTIWPTSAARDDVFEIALRSADEVHRVLALRAFVRLTGLEKYRAPQAAVEDLRKALEIASRPEEKKLILSSLPDFSCPDAIKLAATLVNDKDVKAEARVALDKIKEKLVKD